MRRINRWKIESLIRNTNGKVFSARFIKKNGEIRDIVCRLETQTGVKGTGESPDKLDNPYVSVYDMQQQGYRLINLQTIRTIKAEKEEYLVV